MPQYKVNAPGFYDSKLYDPEGKRPVLYVDKPFTKKNPMPSWVSEMPKESAGLKKKREALEKAQVNLDAEKAEQDKEDIADASFMGEGEKVTPDNNVETI